MIDHCYPTTLSIQQQSEWSDAPAGQSSLGETYSHRNKCFSTHSPSAYFDSVHHGDADIQ